MAQSNRNPSSYGAWLFSSLRIAGFLLSPRIWQGLAEWQRWRTSAVSSTLIMDAIYADDVDKCKELVEKGKDCNQVKDGNLPLIVTSAKGNLAIVRLLVETGGADITVVNENGERALLSAAHHGHLPVVSYLIEKGADKDYACCLNMTALYYAAQNNRVDVVRYLIDQGCCINTADIFGRLF